MAGVGSVLRNSSALRVFSREIRRSFYLSSRTLKDRNEDGNWLPLKQEDATIAVHAGYDPKEHPNGPLVPPISLGTTFEQHSPGQFKGHHYIRQSNPTRASLEKTLAALDRGKYGFAYSSGCSAILNVLSLIKPGDVVLAVDDVYGGTNCILKQYGEKFGIQTEFLDLCKLENFEAALKPNTKLVWLETPTNPLLKVIDIQRVVNAVKSYSKDILVAVDNTLLSSFLQKPLTLGADLVVYSLTKYMNGHTDALMGAVVTDRDDLATRLAFLQNALGAVPSPFDSYLVLRGLKTLHVRMPLHMRNGLEVAKFLQGHSKVKQVFHPGLNPSSPDYEIAMKQCSGHSGVVTFYVHDEGKGREFVKHLKLCKLATSFGGFETMLELPITGSKATVPEDVRQKLGITENLVRLSVGLESADDIKADLDQALQKC